MLFTAEELEEMRLADEEIERDFGPTPEELALSRARDREAAVENMPYAKRKRAEYQRAWYTENKDEVAAYQRAYREARRDMKEERE